MWYDKLCRNVNIIWSPMTHRNRNISLTAKKKIWRQGWHKAKEGTCFCLIIFDFFPVVILWYFLSKKVVENHAVFNDTSYRLKKDNIRYNTSNWQTSGSLKRKTEPWQQISAFKSILWDQAKGLFTTDARSFYFSLKWTDEAELTFCSQILN